MNLIDWNSIGTYLLPVVTGVASWLAGRNKSKNDFLTDLQLSINLLAKENKDLLAEIVLLRKENASLLANQNAMKLQMDKMQTENEALNRQVESLFTKLENVKTITKVTAK